MTYLKDLGFSEATINIINANFQPQTLEYLNKEQEIVTKNINYLKELGVTNYVAAFIKFSNMFLLDSSTFEEIFSKYDTEDLIIKLEKNVGIMEYL